MPGLASVTDLGAGKSHSAVRTVDGTVWAWGANSYASSETGRSPSA